MQVAALTVPDDLDVPPDARDDGGKAARHPLDQGAPDPLAIGGQHEDVRGPVVVEDVVLPHWTDEAEVGGECSRAEKAIVFHGTDQKEAGVGGLQREPGGRLEEVVDPLGPRDASEVEDHDGPRRVPRARAESATAVLVRPEIDRVDPVEDDRTRDGEMAAGRPAPLSGELGGPAAPP